MPSLPTGTVTFLFTDIEGSTTLLQRLGDRRYAETLAEHQRLLREAFANGNGQEIDTQGDAFLVAFPRARDALATAVAAQQVLTKYSWPDGVLLRVRMGLHTGEPVSGTKGYVGLDVHRAARICAAGHGGQILVSQTVKDLVALDLPAGVSLRDLGLHRLKDLQEPEHLLQVVHTDLLSDFPALKSLNVRPNNLPRQLTSFIGREKEMAEVKRFLSTAHLVTLTGSGGAGKTRLALQVAAEMVEDCPDGVWLAEFAPIADPSLVPKAVASALNVPEQPGRDMAEALVAALRQKALLLVLDNCEHLLAACADLAASLLRACPQVRILATSREGLGVQGETLWRVPSLSSPDPDRLPALEELTQYEAVRLFADRAALAKSEFRVTRDNAFAVAQVAHQLDGIPLAIELAAARTKALSISVIAERLNDRFRLLTGGSRTSLPSHQTLRATMDWSHSLLSEKEQVLLRRLSVFAGGFTVEAVEEICVGEGVDQGDALDLLTRLVDKSLVVFDERDDTGRYRLLETVRQYGRDKLSESGEAEDLQRRHRNWYLALAEQAWPAYFGAQSMLWLERLESEHDNLRAALEWSRVDKDGAEAGLRLAGALWFFWLRQGHWSEARERLEGVLARRAEAAPTALPRALAGATHFAWRRGDHELAMEMGAEGLALSRRLGDKGATASLLYQLATISRRRGDCEQATAQYTECLALSRELKNHWMISQAYSGLGLVAQWLRGDLELAMRLHTQSLAEMRHTGDQWGIALTLYELGIAARDLYDHDRATASLLEALRVCGKSPDRWLGGQILGGLATVASATGNHDRAARLFGVVEALHEPLHYRLPQKDQAYRDRFINCTREALGDFSFVKVWAEGRAMTLEQAIEYALAER